MLTTAAGLPAGRPDEVLALVGLTDAGGRKVGEFSLGMRQRLGLVTRWDSTVVEVLLGAVLVMVLYGPIGIAVAALVRNQIAAVVGALAWTFIVEQLLVAYAVVLSAVAARLTLRRDLS